MLASCNSIEIYVLVILLLYIIKCPIKHKSKTQLAYVATHQLITNVSTISKLVVKVMITSYKVIMASIVRFSANKSCWVKLQTDHFHSKELIIKVLVLNSKQAEAFSIWNESCFTNSTKSFTKCQVYGLNLVH